MFRQILAWATVPIMGLAGCGAGTTPPARPAAPPPAAAAPDQAQFGEARQVLAIQREPTAIVEQMQGKTGILPLSITDSGFDPANISVSPGTRVKLHVKNAGRHPHNLIISRFGVVTQNIPPGGENYIEFTANASGVWPYLSDAPGEPEPGLSGSLKVE